MNHFVGTEKVPSQALNPPACEHRVCRWEARFARMVLTPIGNSIAISTIEKFKTFAREASLCFRAFTKVESSAYPVLRAARRCPRRLEVGSLRQIAVASAMHREYAEGEAGRLPLTHRRHGYHDGVGRRLGQLVAMACSRIMMVRFFVRVRVIRHQAEGIQVGCDSFQHADHRGRSKATNSVSTSSSGRRFTTTF
jgi:hypothetical protein